MISFTTPTPIRKIADRIKSIAFGDFACNYNVLCALLCLYLFNLRSLSMLARVCSWCYSVSTLQKYLNRLDCSRLMQRMRGAVLLKYKGKLLPEDWCYAVDDTSNPKYGKKIYAKGWWNQHGKTSYQGQKIMFLALVNKKTGYAMPLAYAFCWNKAHPNYKNGQDVAIELIKNIFSEGFPKSLVVVADSWFDSAAFMKNLSEIGAKFSIELKSNRLVKEDEDTKSPWLSWKQIFNKHERTPCKLQPTENQKRPSKQKHTLSCKVHIKKYQGLLNVCAVFNRKNSQDPFAIYATNDPDILPYGIYELSRRRWHIEETFRDLKQNLAFGKLPCTGQKAAESSICLPCLLLTYIRLYPEEWDQKPGQPKTIGLTLAAVKERNFATAMGYLLNRPDSILCKKLRSRRHPDRLKIKPVDNAGADRLEAA